MKSNESGEPSIHVLLGKKLSFENCSVKFETSIHAIIYNLLSKSGAYIFT